MAGNCVVIGAGMAGARLVERLRARAPTRPIVLYGEEPGPCYNRVLLSGVLADELAFDDATTLDDVWCSRHAVTFRPGCKVVALDPDARTVTDARGRVTAFDTAVLATGSRSVRLPLPGADLDGVTTFRTFQDVATLRARARNGGRAIVIGGGLLGLEAAHGLNLAGMETTVVHLEPHLMERQLDADASTLLERSLALRGIRVLTGTRSQALEGDSDRHVRALRLADGRRLPADLVVMCVGIRPETALARAAGLDCRHGIVVDDQLRSSRAGIFAVGECAEHDGRTYGLVAPLWEQIDVLAAHLTGGSAAYRGSVTSTALKVSGIQMFSIGDVAASCDADPIVVRDATGSVYRRLTVRDGRLTGACLFGDTSHQGWYRDLVADATPVDPIRDHLMFGPP